MFLGLHRFVDSSKYGPFGRTSGDVQQGLFQDNYGPDLIIWGVKVDKLIFVFINTGANQRSSNNLGRQSEMGSKRRQEILD